MPQGTFELEIRSNIRELRQQIDGLGRRFDTIGARGTRNIDQFNDRLKVTEARSANIVSSFRRLLLLAGGLGALTGFTRALGRASDRATRLQNTLIAITDNESERVYLNERLTEIAQENFIYTDEAANALLQYLATSRSTGFTLEQNLDIVEAIAAGSAALGLSAIQTNTAYSQVAQSLGQQRVELENIKTLQEAAPALVEKIREAYERRTGDTRSLLAVTRAGELSGRAFGLAVADAGAGLADLRSEAEKTFDQIIVGVKDAFSGFAAGFLSTGNAANFFIGSLKILTDLLRSDVFLSLSQFTFLSGALSTVAITAGVGVEKLASAFFGFGEAARISTREYLRQLGALERGLRRNEQIAANAAQRLQQAQLFNPDDVHRYNVALNEAERTAYRYRGEIDKLTASYTRNLTLGSRLRANLRGLVTNFNFLASVVAIAVSAFLVFYKTLDDRVREIQQRGNPWAIFTKDINDFTAALKTNTEEVRKNLEVFIAARAAEARERIRDDEETEADLLRRETRQQRLVDRQRARLSSGRTARGTPFTPAQTRALEEGLQGNEDELAKTREELRVTQGSLKRDREFLVDVGNGTQEALKTMEESLGVNTVEIKANTDVQKRVPQPGDPDFIGPVRRPPVDDRGLPLRGPARSGASDIDETRQRSVRGILQNNAAGYGQEAADALGEGFRASFARLAESGSFIDDDIENALKEQLGQALLDGVSSAITDVAVKGIQKSFALLGQLFSNFATGFAGGGGFSGGFGNLTAGFNQGGLVLGPGTGTSDSINARLSNGEFVVNAASTRSNLGALQAINSGGRAGAGVANEYNISMNISPQTPEDFLRQAQEGGQQIADIVNQANFERGVI